MGAGYQAAGLGLAVAAALLACRRCTGQASPGCMPELVRLTPCMGYMSGNATAPGAPCCSALSGVLRSSPPCLCTVLGGTAASLGVAVDSARALQLPGACKVQAPPASQCNAVGVSSSSPVTPNSTPASSSKPDASPEGSGSKSTQYSNGNINRSGRSLTFVILVAAALIHRA